MGFEHNDLSGSLFENDKKERDNQPDFTGSCKIEGVEYWMSAWVKTGNKGDWLSCAFTEKDTQQKGLVRENKPKGSNFLGKKRQGNSARNEQKKAADAKYEKEMAEYQKMTGKQIIENEMDNFDDDIPF